MPEKTIEITNQPNEGLRLHSNKLYSEKKYQELIDNIDEGFCVVEMIHDAREVPVDYRFIEKNAAFERITGLKNVLGRTINEVVPEHGLHWFEIFDKAARTGEAIQFQSAATLRGRYYDIYAYRIGGKGSQLVGILFKDITQNKKTEDSRRQNEKEYPLLFGDSIQTEKNFTPDKLKKLSLLLSILVVSVAIVVLVGWSAHIPFLKTFSFRWISMKVNTALSFLLAGISLILLNNYKSGRKLKMLPSAFSLILLCLATITLSEYIFHFSAGLDELIFKDTPVVEGMASPGRPPIPTAFCFFVTGIALFLLSIKKINASVYQVMNLIVGIAGLFLTLGFFFGIKELKDGSSDIAVAVPTSISFLMLSLASLFLLPQSGIMRLVSSNTSGGLLIRRSFPLVVITIIILGWLTMEEKWTPFYDVFLGMTVYLTVIVIVFSIVIFSNASSLTKSENQIKREKEFSSYLLDTIPGIFYLVDDTGRNLKWNKTVEMATGYTSSEIAGMKTYDFFAEQEKAVLADKMREAFTKGESMAELNLKSRSGQLTPYYFSAKKILLEGRDLLIGTALDISESKRLAQERELYYKFFNTTQDIMVVADPLGCIQKVNRACLQLLGYSEEELISKPFVDFICEEDKQRTYDEMTQQMQRGYSLNFENRYTCKNGTLVWLSWRAQYNAQEGLTYATARDITEHKLMEDKLRQSETKYRSLFENMIEGYALCQMLYNTKGEPVDFTYVEANKRFEQLTGLTNVKGKKWTELFPARKEKHPDLPYLYNKVLTTGITEKKETYYDDKDVWYAFTIAPFSRDHFIFVFEDITDKKKAEQTLQESSLYNRSLIEASPDPMVTISHEGKITDVNEATVNITGVERATLIGNDFTNYFTEPKKAKEGYQKVLQEGSVTDYPLTIRHVNGKLTEVLYNASLYKDISGKISGVFAAARDVTESRQMQQRLMSSEARLKEAQRLAKIGNWELDLLTNELKWSDEIYHIFELDPKVFGATYEAFLKAIHPDDRELVSHAYETSVINHTPYRIDHRLLMKDGNIKNVHEQCETFYDDSGKPIRSIGTVQDISERKAMEELLRSANVYTRSLIEASLDPLVTISPEGKITDVNYATVKVTGVERPKLIGTDFSNYFTEPEKAKKGYQQVLTEGFVTDYALTIRSKNGKLTEVLYNASVYKDASGRIIGVFAAARDVTAQKKAEIQLHKLNLTLEEKVKERTVQFETVNKELEAFTYSVSHDLRAPLRAINSYSQILNEDYTDQLDEDGKQILESIRYNTAKMGKLIDELLAFSRLGRKQLERTEIDMNALVKEVIDELNNTTPHHAEITIGQLPLVKADYTLLSQVMHNLISNAIKYSSKKEKPVIEIFMEEKNGKPVFVVKDNGVGFDMRYADKLFGVFQRLHSEKEFEGNGVGLAIVKRIINKHGGEVWAFAEENKGASFYFILN